MKKTLEQIFKIREHNTTIKKELLAGFTTFITMAYIIFVNPQIMSSTGMDQGAIFVGTCLAAAVACFVMGLIATGQLASPRHGFECIFYLYSCWGNGLFMGNCTWCSFYSRNTFFIMSITRLRGWMITSIPLNLRIAMGAG
ncbi:MAG: hypothetical protein CM15mP127_06580 [Gammaproteobacteria bacterium]|nr:MAG: hypothetical protein CM15mP127_06580 [Gammaproteobacteria bacterium]